MANPARKKDEKEGSRSRILEGATEEFAAAGFAGARIDRIARRTRLNVRMIYYHFGSKKGLYRAVLQGIYEQAVHILDESERFEEPTLPALGMYFDLLAEHPMFANVLVREILDGAKHLKALFKERPDLFKRVHLRAREIIETGIEQGLLETADTPLTVMSLTAIVCFLTAGREAMPLFLDGRLPDTTEFKAHLFSLLLEGLRKR